MKNLKDEEGKHFNTNVLSRGDNKQANEIKKRKKKRNKQIKKRHKYIKKGNNKEIKKKLTFTETKI